MKRWIKWAIVVAIVAVPVTAYAAWQQIDPGSCPFVDDCPCE